MWWSTEPGIETRRGQCIFQMLRWQGRRLVDVVPKITSIFSLMLEKTKKNHILFSNVIIMFCIRVWRATIVRIFIYTRVNVFIYYLSVIQINLEWIRIVNFFPTCLMLILSEIVRPHQDKIWPHYWIVDMMDLYIVWCIIR